ncbi:MAG: DMT family transporter [Candidatus Aenigmarchaeota archaeon]|nr:DMT family transporter [Candidatus Aenigmarchaeota archaeon]
MEISLGILFGLMAMIGWGLADFFAKKTVEKIGDFKTLLWTQIIGLAVLTAFYFPFGHGFIYRFIDIMTFVIIGLSGSSAYLLFYRALKKGQVSVLSPIQASWVIVTIIISLIFLKESLNFLQSIAIIIIVVGILLVSFKYKDLKKFKLDNLLPGVSEDLISMGIWGVNFAIIGFLVSKFNWFVPMFFLRVFMVLSLLSFSGVKRMNITFGKREVIPWLILIGLCDAMAFIGFGLGTSTTYISIVSPVAASFPLVTIILARIFLGEKLDINQKIGVIGILIGLIILSL